MRNASRHNFLPGGIVREGTCVRSFTLAPLTGRIELALALGREAGPRFHEQLTAAIALGIERIGEQPVTESLAADLAVGDRQFLARLLGARCGGDEVWLSSRCPHCQAWFDLPVRQTLLPVKPAGGEFPTVSVRLSAWLIRCRIPTGQDQRALANADTIDARRWLIDRLIEDAPPDYPGTARLDDKDIDRADAAIEDAAPEVGTTVQTACPSCGCATRVEVGPYIGLLHDEAELLEEVHQIALSYHWSEADILDLPTARRRRYLTLIDRAGGVLV